ncbi:MAG: universal stress protein [Deltaproteobacteria bacterium]|nr:universal stress protein [Deltaproteobacteria bacterium]MDL1962492.1 universal stress protein [Deltaproteobacteria bacterium]
MVEVKKILFPVDFYESSNKVLPYVKFMAEKLGAQIELIHVVRGPGDFTGYEMGGAWYSSYEGELLKGGEKAMERFKEEKLSGLDVKTTVAVGDITEEIIKHAQKTGSDMIIIGTHGRKGLERVMFGSVARGVVRGASCPVLTVNPFKVST